MQALLPLLAAALALVLVAHWVALHPTPAAVVQFPPEAPILGTWVGGVLWLAFGLPWRFTGPMAKLELLVDGVRIGPNGRAFGFVIPTWELRWSRIDTIEEASNGISFFTQNGEYLKFLVLTTRTRRKYILTEIESARAGI